LLWHAFSLHYDYISVIWYRRFLACLWLFVDDDDDVFNFKATKMKLNETRQNEVKSTELKVIGQLISFQFISVALNTPFYMSTDQSISMQNTFTHLVQSVTWRSQMHNVHQASKNYCIFLVLFLVLVNIKMIFV